MLYLLVLDWEAVERKPNSHQWAYHLCVHPTHPVSCLYTDFKTFHWTDCQTDKLMDRQNRLLKPFTHTHMGNETSV